MNECMFHSYEFKKKRKTKKKQKDNKIIKIQNKKLKIKLKKKIWQIYADGLLPFHRYQDVYVRCTFCYIYTFPMKMK